MFIQFVIGLIVVYILYYSLLIIYDLFLHKEKVVVNTEVEEFSLENYVEENVQNVKIDDVEDLKTPSFLHKNDDNVDSFKSEELPNLEDLKNRFEDEQTIDIEKPSNFETKQILKEKQLRKNNEEFFKLLSLSETQVKLVSNQDGHKVYHSLL